MRLKLAYAIVLLFAVLSLVFIMPPTVAESDKSAQTFEDQFGVLNQKLYVSVPPSLYSYYGNVSYKVNKDADYVKLVTPAAVEPIAACIKALASTLPNSDEQFADAVLALVHRIPYSITGPKYPVKTLVDKSGDCTALSLLAASIMKAGGLDVVLIHYTGINPGHMNVGVYLPYTPAYHTAFMKPTSFEYANKTYWTAEATAEADWKVGDQADSLAVAQPVIIPLGKVDNSSIAQVSASLATPLMPSSITEELSQQPSSTLDNARALTIFGSVSPAQSNSTVTVYIIHEGGSSDYFTTLTDENGRYMLIWDFTSEGTYCITSCWSGDSEYAGSDSETLTVFIGPESLLQFQTTFYNYIYGRAGMGSYVLRPFLGIDEFLSFPLGTNVTFSYDFTVLPTGHAGSNIQTKNITIPARRQTIILSRRQIRTIVIPEYTLVVPTNVPLGLQPLRLPDDFNQTIRNQFCLVLQSTSLDNYSLSLEGLSGYDMANLQDTESKAAIVNASGSIEENTWYRLTATISANQITTNINEVNGTLIQSQTTYHDTTGTNKTVFLLANNIDSALAFRNLKIQTLDDNAKQPEKPSPTGSEGLAPYFVMSTALALLCATILALIAKERHNQKLNSNRGKSKNC